MPTGPPGTKSQIPGTKNLYIMDKLADLVQMHRGQGKERIFTVLIKLSVCFLSVNEHSLLKL